MPVVKMAVTDVCRSEMRESQSLLRVVLAVDDKKAKGKGAGKGKGNKGKR